MNNHKYLKAWARQSVEESQRVEKTYDQLTELQKLSAIKNIDLYNSIWKVSHDCHEWTWFVTPGHTIVQRAFLQE